MTRSIRLRPWQKTALEKFVASDAADFLTVATPGAGKTTIMNLLTGQEFPTGGSIEVFGANPLENASVLARVAFIKESQKYPDEFRPIDVFRSAPWFFEHWDAAFAEQLIAEFRVPLKRKIKKLSRGQLSSIGVIVGLAGAAGVTRVLQTFLFGVTPTDPIAFTIVTLLLMAVGLMAAWLPARRATRIDPSAALRAE